MKVREQAESIFASIRKYLDSRIDPVSERIKTLEDTGPRPINAAERKEMLDELKQHVESHHSRWAIDFERSATDLMLKQIANIPEPEPGRDAFELEDLTIEHDGERTVTLKFDNGKTAKEKTITVPALLDRGVYQKDAAYERGDGVTFGGSFWIAQKATSEKPGTGDGWRLAVKKGRDGKSNV